MSRGTPVSAGAGFAIWQMPDFHFSNEDKAFEIPKMFFARMTSKEGIERRYGLATRLAIFAEHAELPTHAAGRRRVLSWDDNLPRVPWRRDAI